jgi:hypothetical protein
MSMNPIATLASQILLSDRATYPIIELTCDLVVADARLNVWCADRKHAGDVPESLSDDDWLSLLADGEQIHADLLRALETYLSSEWPRGEPDVWTRHGEWFASELRAGIRRIDQLGRKWGRVNQRVLRE